MSLTPRGLALLLTAAIPLLAGGIVAWAAPVWVAVALGLILADHRRAPGPESLEIERVCDTKLSLGAANRIELRVRAGVDLRGRLRDEFPAEFGHDVHTHDVDVPVDGERSLEYRVTPYRRGAYAFGDVHLRLVGPLGLAVRAVRVPAAAEVRVYPDILQVRRFDMLARRDRAHRLGLRRIRDRGTGTEIERLREYASDDDVRRIDWKATARRHAPITREYEAERSQDVLFLLDAGRLMGGPLGDLTRLDHAVNATLLAAHVAIGRGDRVGLAAFSDRVLLDLPARKGRAHFHRMLEALYDLRAEPTEPDFERAMLHLATRRRRRSLLVIFTEVFHPETTRGLVRALSRTGLRHLPLCVTASDPEIVELRRRRPRSPRDVDRRAVAERVLREKGAALEMLAARGVLVTDVAADRMSAAVVDRYLEIKARAML